MAIGSNETGVAMQRLAERNMSPPNARWQVSDAKVRMAAVRYGLAIGLCRGYADLDVGNDPSYMKSNVRIASEIGISVTTMRTARARQAAMT
jgi:hypothetical protein